MFFNLVKMSYTKNMAQNNEKITWLKLKIIDNLTPRGKLRLGGVRMRRSAFDLFLTTLEWIAQETQ